MFTRILALLWADILAGYALWMLMIYLTDVWKLNLTHAAAIINIYVGLMSIFPLAQLFLVNSWLGNFWMLLLSSLSYCVGLLLLTMSTPPVLAKTLETCTAYDPECIGDGQKILFYVAVALIAVGTSGHTISLGNFIAEQLFNAVDNFDFSTCSFLTVFGGNIVTFFLTIAAVLALPYIKPWSLRLGIPAIFMAVAILVFLSGVRTYTRNRPVGSPLTLVLRVITASVSKLFQPRPEDANQYYGVREYISQISSIPPIRCCRCLEKAAIILPNPTLELQEKNRWKLCTVTEVRSVQYIFFYIPVATAFIFWGFLSSLLYTYFLEQAKTMNHKVGNLTLPLTIFFWFYAQGKEYIPKLYFYAASRLRNASFSAPIIGIFLSMVFGILCCVTAASVESRRLDVVKKHGLLDKPDEQVPMSVFWLLPQFILLGAVDGISSNSVALYLNNYFTLTWNQFLMTFSSLVHGLGCIGSVVFVYIVGKVSENGGNLSWFQDTLNHSRLDKYYWTLSWLIAVNIGLYIVLRFWYSHMELKEEDAPGESGCCCCC